MPPYYAQQMAAAAHRPCRVASEVKSPGDDLDVTATRDEAGMGNRPEGRQRGR